MSDSQIRIAIAEACGWRPEDAKSGFRGSRDSDGRLWACESIPDYCNDLNAMHEAENNFPHPSDWYQHNLALVCGARNPIYRATARQRAEAFLRTIGKWEEGREMSDTPETDDAQWGTGKVTTDFAKRLERERDEAIRALTNITALPTLAVDQNVVRARKIAQEALRNVEGAK